jgi:hypothetical protein
MVHRHDIITGLPETGDASEAGSGTPASTVTSETSYGITPAVGTSLNYSREDHTHGTMSTPTKTTVGLGNVPNLDTSTTANIIDSTDKRFITDAQQTVLGNTSGTNTGDNATNTQYSGLATSKENTGVAATLVSNHNSATTGIHGSGANSLIFSNDSRLTDARTPLAHNQAESTITFTDITTGNASSSTHGFLPKLDNTGTKYLRDDGTWQTVSGGSGITSTQIGLVVDGGSNVITTGSKGYRTIPYTGTITGWTIMGDVSGSIVIDVKKSTYAGFPTTSSIAGSEKPTLSSSQKNQDLTLSTWTTSVTAGDVLEFNVDSATTVKKIWLSIDILKV